MADIIIMDGKCPEENINAVIDKIKMLGFDVNLSRGTEKIIIGIIGDTRELSEEVFVSFPGVIDVISILKDYKLVTREFHPADTTVFAGNIVIDNKHFVIAAGPCSVESYDQMFTTAVFIKNHNGKILRGGAYKPRTSPYSFVGLGKEGLAILKDVKNETGLPVITEVLAPEEVEIVADVADILQIGARNMYNYRLLERVGRTSIPVMLKRGFQATIGEFLSCAEYILKAGNNQVILCERGIRTFDSQFTRNCLDLSAIPVLKKESHLPVFVDPSHGTGKRELVIPMSRAAVAAGADGLIVEVHPKPEEALSDGYQSLTFDLFEKLIKEITPFIHIMGRII
ncbi:MAG: Phospho-2-dehydro-3-deoxyheptonate aldolase [candidate division TA06 bacterium ADurb.Bin131]|uniref:Phospho-2-dehydro-3-deoxyheptonate aldolase n=1 Tax=candidate division TA06 bacterium ADurb.Bin131 TaxID=1852827 RepID=A0A1V6C451_UNCT6|nr:MAG: Phospho-2-dehydro-3-deoxyheptonate aldolase [candidate division TA06 bacterium ADurb.Bin131]HOC02692.1 3-deoxy-7-phosphoheptulonate synthase [bacterium]HON04999.1 3-deoxy-7-phosphoheptulonate synthase [bacterium]